MRLASYLAVGLLSLVLTGCIKPVTTPSCLSSTDNLAEASRARYLHGDLAGAARLQHQATLLLEQCFVLHRAERTLEAERRLGEMWMISGELEQRAGDVRSAKLSLLRAKGIFSTLRRNPHLRGSTLDLVLLESREVKEDLKAL